MGLLWVPQGDKYIADRRYTTLNAYGQVFLLYRTLFGVLVSDHDVPASFNTSTADTAILLRGRSVSEDLYLSLERSSNPTLPTARQLASLRLKEKGLKPHHLITASLARVPAVYRDAFAMSLEKVIDKYFMQL